MIQQIISADAFASRKYFTKSADHLKISEFFFNSIQGEGIHIGHPAAFLRLQGCHLRCSYCDTTEVWKNGSQYTFPELFDLIEMSGLIDKLIAGQHLVITGGSPLLQQENLLRFLKAFSYNYQFMPFIEIENECAIRPLTGLLNHINCWNNSPKLTSSDSIYNQFNADLIAYMANLNNSWFKFVITSEKDWNEIEECYLKAHLIKYEQIILMPEGATRVQLEKTRNITLDLAVKHSVRYCTREHIILWDKKVGC